MMSNQVHVFPDVVNSWFRKTLRNPRQAVLELTDVLKVF